jgi:hypothetical protein
MDGGIVITVTSVSIRWRIEDLYPDLIFISGIMLFVIIITAMILMFYPPSSNDSVSTELTRKELCIIENSLKYPTAENYTINRLCYLEELGRSLAQ